MAANDAVESAIEMLRQMSLEEEHAGSLFEAHRHAHKELNATKDHRLLVEAAFRRAAEARELEMHARESATQDVREVSEFVERERQAELETLAEQEMRVRTAETLGRAQRHRHQRTCTKRWRSIGRWCNPGRPGRRGAGMRMPPASTCILFWSVLIMHGSFSGCPHQ